MMTHQGFHQNGRSSDRNRSFLRVNTPHRSKIIFEDKQTLSGAGIVDSVLDSIPTIVNTASSVGISAAASTPGAALAMNAGKMAFNRFGGTNFLRNKYQQALRYSGKANPLARDLYPGELHVVEGPGSAYPTSLHNFTGPGTDIVSRMRRGDRPVNSTDRVSMLHDIQYLNAKNPEDVRNADLQALNGFRASQQDKIVASLAAKAMTAKMKMEDAGLLNPMRYIGNKSMIAGAGAGDDEEEERIIPGLNLVKMAASVAKARRKNRKNKA